MITPIDVLDSAVKIGLGAMISGLATYWLAKASHDKTLEKERAQRKREILEAVAQQVASLDEVALRYRQTVLDWIQAAEPVSETARAVLARARGEISDASKEFTSVEAKLLLLGEMKCHELFREYALGVRIFPVDVVLNRTLPVANITASRDRLREKREQFFAQLSDVYKRL